MRKIKTPEGVARYLKSKRVVDVRLNPFHDGKPWHHQNETYDPVIVFSDGSCLMFSVHEATEGFHGIDLHYGHPPKEEKQ